MFCTDSSNTEPKFHFLNTYKFTLCLPETHAVVMLYYVCTAFKALNSQRTWLIKQVNEKSCRLRMATYMNGVKRKGEKIGMGQ